jgi:hypothetical protein
MGDTDLGKLVAEVKELIDDVVQNENRLLLLISRMHGVPVTLVMLQSTGAGVFLNKVLRPRLVEGSPLAIVTLALIQKWVCVQH